MNMVFTWPAALLFWLVFAWAFAPEFRIFQRPEERFSAQDAGSKRLIQSGGSLGMLAAFLLAAFARAAAMPHPGMLFLTGIALMIGGSLLRRHCWRMLGASFTGAVIVRASQTVVERGAYRYVRHPSYTAGALLVIGIGIALANWLSILVIVASTVLVYAYRVRVEEAALCAIIGDPYSVYMARTKRFVPYVF